VSAADNGTVVEIALNRSAVADLNSAIGLFVLGGALSSISGTADQHVFGFSMASFVSDHTRQLVLDVMRCVYVCSHNLIRIGVRHIFIAGLHVGISGSTGLLRSQGWIPRLNSSNRKLLPRYVAGHNGTAMAARPVASA
jgi:hypothetical protein